MTKNLTETIFKDLDSITKYNIKQLMDYLNKNKVLRQILVLKQNLIKEKKDDIIERNIIEMDELKASLENLVEEEKSNALDVKFNDESEDDTSLKCNMQIFNERKLNVKDVNVEEGVLRKEAHYLVQKHLDQRHDAVRQQSRRPCELEVSGIEPHSSNPRLLTYRRPERWRRLYKAVEGQMANTNDEHRWLK